MTTCLCIWLPNWPIQRVLAAEPALVGRCVVLETRDARRGLLVAAANLSARRAGARVGMRMSELAALKPTDDSALWEIREYQPHADLDTLCDLAEQAQQFSPLVGLEPVEAEAWHGRSSLQPQALLLDATGVPSLFGGPEAYLASIAEWLRNQRFFAYMALASTVGAAWALANYEILRQLKRNPSPAPPADQDLLNFVPDCRTIVTEHWEEAELLSSLPIGALRIDSQSVDKLRRLGVHTLNQLWQLPRDGLASRLGTQLMVRSDQALGLAGEPIVALHAQPEWCCEFSLEYPTLALITLNGALEQLCTQLAARLTKGGQGALRCVCRLDRVQRPPLVMQLGLFRPTDDGRHLHMLLSGQLEQVLQQMEPVTTRPSYGRPSLPNKPQPDEVGAVCRVNLSATLVGPIHWQQTQLFDQGDVRHKQQLAQLIDLLSGRLGRDQVLEAKVQRDAEPDQSVAYQPLTGRRQDGTEQQTVRKLNSRLANAGAEPRPTDPLRRPSQLFTPPELLMGPSLSEEGLLLEFVYEQRRIQVTGHWGPERLESGWWRGPSLRRDYYRIEARDGSWWWVFRDVLTGQWYLHGMFA